MLALIFIAMPVKYIGGNPLLVKIIGPIHGALFVAFVVCVILVSSFQKWPKRLLVFALVSSTIPFGMFMLDKKLKSRERTTNSVVVDRKDV